jgi:hypothetical protein
MLAIGLTLVLAMAPAPVRSAADQVAVTATAAIVELDMDKLKGEPWRLAWSPDAKEIYVQTIERDSHGAVKGTKHYLVAVAEKTLKGIDQEPAWASKYWSWKSAQMSPAAPAFKIKVDQRTETKRSTAAPTGGELAKGGLPDPAAGSTLSDVASAASQMQNMNIFALKVQGEVLGEWINEPVTPGINFGWAPGPQHLLAFARRDGDRRDTGALTLLDETGHKEEVPNTKSVWLPAFSEDGHRLAWLARKDRKHFALTIGSVETH